MADAMDSKSISREGVGVQVPASAPAIQTDELARALLPVLLHKLNNVTQVIASVNSLVRLTGESTPIAKCAADLDHSAGMLARLGWLLGALARGVGTDLGSQRHEERALEWLLELLAEALRREGRELAPAGALPRLDPQSCAATSWAVASRLLECARSGADSAPLVWSLRREGDEFVLRTSRGPSAAVPALANVRCEVLA